MNGFIDRCRQRGLAVLAVGLQHTQLTLLRKSLSHFGGAVIITADAAPHYTQRQLRRALGGTVLLGLGPLAAVAAGTVGFLAGPARGPRPVIVLAGATLAELAAWRIGVGLNP